MECSSDKSQYDKLLGGQYDLPSSLPIRKYLITRIQEINALTKIIETPSNAITEIRSFPKHMKRRAMSHNIRRIPKRLRELHGVLREKSNTREGPSKVPRRKYRRRPKELLKEYNRRQKKNVWLETHIWHAKRFQMVTKWGYKLPLTPCDKSYRACYRATANHCLLQDISYYNCIELLGLQENILSGLSKHTNSEAGLTFAAQASLSGCREGSVMFYKTNSYPYGCIGEINFIWRPIFDKKQSRSIWLWCHPGTYEEIIKELITTFELVEEQVDDPMDSTDELSINDVKNEVETKKIELRNIPFVRTPKYSNQEGITLIALKDTLNRFRIVGPLSQAILSQCLRPVCLAKRQQNVNQDWVHGYYFGKGDTKKISYDAQVKLWSSIKQFYSPGQLTPRFILPLTIIDPRFIMPYSRTKAIDDISNQELPSFNMPLDHAHLDSPIWSSSVRDSVTKSKLSTEELNRMRSEKLVPGLDVENFDNNEFETVPCLPVLMIQKPGSQDNNKRLGYGSGWDVIIPCGYAMPFWLSLVLSGARVGGLREANALSRESGIDQGNYQPDTIVGRLEDVENKNTNTDKFFSLPPAKRRNYIKLNIPTPFHCPWSVLTKDWEQTEEFYVLRNKKLLYLLNNSLKNGSNCNYLNENKVLPGALIPVRIDFKGKGILGPNAHICLQSDVDDVKTLPKEPQQHDELHDERLNKRKKHKQILKQLARKRHKVRVAQREERFDETSKDDKNFKQTVLNNSSDKNIKEHADQMRKLWLPSCSTIKDACSRTIIGFVSCGDFCFTEGISSGIGYISFNGFKEYLQTRISKKKFILIRCITTDQYRLASMCIIV